MQKRIMIAGLLFTLSACSNGSYDGGVKPHETLAEALNGLAASGQLPELDHSDSIAGPDKDNNGIRDDIDRYLASRNLKPNELAAEQQTARAIQRDLLTDTSNKKALAEAAKGNGDAVECAWNVIDETGNKNLAKLDYDLEGFTVNTKKRIVAYAKFNHALSGGVYGLNNDHPCEN